MTALSIKLSKYAYPLGTRIVRRIHSNFSADEQAHLQAQMQRVAQNLALKDVLYSPIKTNTILDSLKAPIVPLIDLPILFYSLIKAISGILDHNPTALLAGIFTFLPWFTGRFLPFILSEGMYSPGQGVRFFYFGKQGIKLHPNLRNNYREMALDHELVHHFRFSGKIKDDRIAEAVAIVNQLEKGNDLPKNYTRIFEKTMDQLETGQAADVFKALDRKGKMFAKLHIGEIFSCSYEFGEIVGAMAWYIRQQTDNSQLMWGFIKQIGEGSPVKQAYQTAITTS